MTKKLRDKKSSSMRIVNTVPKLIDYIRRQLGEPVIQVEVTDEQIENCIYDTIQLFGEYAYQGREEVVLVVDIDNPNKKEFMLDPRVRFITNLRQTSNISSYLAVLPGYSISQSNTLTLTMLNTLNFADITGMCSSLARISNLESLFDIPINFTWNEHTKILKILEPIHKSQYMLIEAVLDYEPQEEDFIFNHPWIKRMSTAKTKYLWGSNVGKYSGSIINGATINYDRIISEAQAEIEALTTELKDNYMEPLGIYVC